MTNHHNYSFERYIKMTDQQLIDHYHLLKRHISLQDAKRGIMCKTLRDDNLCAAISNRKLWNKI